MALKLTVAIGDQIVVGDDLVIEVLSTGHRPQLAFTAPSDVKIVNIKADKSQMFKNRKRVAEGRKPGGSPRFDK